MRVTLRPTVPEDLPHCIVEPLPYRIKAITALIGDEIVGFGGIGYRPDGIVIGFAQFTPEFRKYPVAVHRAGLMMMDIIRRSGVTKVIAEAQANNPAAERWLLRLGFQFETHGHVEGYVWRRERHAPDDR